MKKFGYVCAAILASSIVLVGANVIAQDFSAPVPIASDANQVGGAGVLKTKSDATSVKFFTHPSPPATDQNFGSNTVTLPDGSSVNIDDMAATPGLLPEHIVKPIAPPGTVGGMLDDMLAESELPNGPIDPQPVQGFCPAAWKWDNFPKIIRRPSALPTSTTTNFEFVFECDNRKYPSYIPKYSNQTDRQFEVADIRKSSSGEFQQLLDSDPLVEGIIGDAQETLTPYTDKTYPATLMSDRYFAWKWFSMTIEPDGAPYLAGILNLDEPYKHVYTYGIADVTQAGKKGGLVSAAYDPVFVEKWVKTSLINTTGNTLVAKADPVPPKLYNLFARHISPLVFFRKDDTTGRMRLAGYSSLHLNKLDFKDVTTRQESVGEFFRKLLLSLNFNPVDVQPIQAVDSQGNSHSGIAVVNQATLGDIDGCIRKDDGYCLPNKWRDQLGTGQNVNPIPTSGSPGDVFLPHSIVSYVTFWEKVQPWTNDPSFTPLVDNLHNPTDNPNEAFEPVFAALIGPGVFHSAVLNDSIGGLEKQSIIAASGDPASDKKYYIYKIDPIQNEITQIRRKYISISRIDDTGFFLGEPYVVEPPEAGFAPYEVRTGNFNNDNCGDIVLTWRGQHAVATKDTLDDNNTPYFDNHDGDTVRFRKSETSDVMFSDVVTVYLGKENGGKCVFDTNKIELRGMASDDPKRQIAAVAVYDFDKDGYDDIIAGNLNPMETSTSTSSNKQFSAYAYLYKNKIGVADLTGQSPRLIRVGYGTAKYGPEGGDDGKYLKYVAENSPKFTGIAGVGALDVDANGNIGAAMGFPLMLPLFGCPQFGPDFNKPRDFVVESVPELLWSLIYDITSNHKWRTLAGDILPMRCVKQDIPPYSQHRPGGLIAEPFGGNVDSETCNEPVAGAGPLIDCCDNPCRNVCKQYCADPNARALYPVMCGRVDNQCSQWPSLFRQKNELFVDNQGNDSGSSDSGRSEFAERTDKVYDSKAPYIAYMDDLRPVQTQMRQLPTLQQIPKIIVPPKTTGVSESPTLATEPVQAPTLIKQPAIEPIKPTVTTAELIKPTVMTADQIKRTVQFMADFGVLSEEDAPTFVDALDSIDPESLPGMFLKMLIPIVELDDEAVAPEQPAAPIKPLIPTIPLKPIKPPLLPKTQPTAPSNPISGIFDKVKGLFIEDAMANEVSGLGKFRLPRGQVMPGKKELTVILKTTPALIPPPTPPGPGGDPDDPCPSGGECQCPCTPTDCTMPSNKFVATRCSGGSSDAAIVKMAKWNQALRDAIKAGGGDIGSNDIFCEAEYGVMKMQIWEPGGAAPEVSSSELLSESVNPDLVGNIGQAALIQLGGTKPVDFTKTTELPTKANLITNPMILMPVSADVSSSIGRKGMTLTPQLSSAVSYVASVEPSLSAAQPAGIDLVTSIDVLPNNSYQLNNVIRWQIIAGNMSKAVGEQSGANHNIHVRPQPLYCSWTAVCPEDSEAFKDENSYAKIDPNKVLTLAKENGSMCQNGVCPAQFFEKLQLPAYQNYGFALVQTKVARQGETPSYDFTSVAFAGGPPMEAGMGGGGCKCDVTALPPDAASLVTMIFIALMVGSGVMFVRFRKGNR